MDSVGRNKIKSETEGEVSSPSVSPSGPRTRAQAGIPLPFPSLREFKIRWPVLFVYAVIHIGAAFAPWFFSWPAFWATLFLWAATGMWGVSAGYHRLLSHRSYDTYHFVKWFHAFWGALSMQLGPITWARLHRTHHAKSDTIEDPHTQQFGFFFGHMGWTFLAHRNVGRSPLLKRELRDLTSDPILRFLEKYYLQLYVASLVGLWVIGGWPMLIWAGFLRTILLLHTTWAVNSIGHRWGSRRFETYDTSQNNAVLAPLTWGEGWHNNHHRFPNSAQFGLTKYEFDIGWVWIRFLKSMGLVWNVKTPSAYSPPPVGPADR